MGSITVASIISLARTELFDETAPYRFTDGKLTEWLNAGQRQIVLLKPTASVANESVQLVAGAKQTLPASGIVLIDIVRNMGSNGNVPGTPISRKDRQSLDALLPTWGSMPAKAQVKYYMFDERDQSRFYVYPKQPDAGQGYVEMIMSCYPDTALVNATITIDDIYEGALLDYIAYRGFRRDDQARAAMYFGTFTQAVTGKKMSEQEISQKRQAAQQAQQ